MISTYPGKVMALSLLTGITFNALAQQDNIPAVLQFAEQYQTLQPQAAHEPETTPEKKLRSNGHKAPTAPHSASNLREKPQTNEKQRWLLKDSQIRQQQQYIAQLEQQLTARTKTKAATPPPSPAPAKPDFNLKMLGSLIQGLKQAWAPQPEQQKLLKNLLLAQQESAKQQGITKTLTTKFNSSEKDKEKLRKQQAELTAQYQLAQTKQQSQTHELNNLRTELAALRAAIPDETTAENLKAAPAQQAYAAGISLGEEILLMQEERQTWGVKTDKKLILAGLVDAFTGQRKLSDEQLNQALTHSESNVLAARDKVMEQQKKQGEGYLAAFKKDKHVQQADEGFWYRLDYAGDQPIASNAIVDVVVKETLTDGTIIQDMEANGVMLSQKVADFPPLFQAAIKLLKNHGSMQMVVPSELAYAEKGYPPKIPPNATMVYRLRIAEMYPENKNNKLTETEKKENKP
ncbi:FKBP-type peptidylprolyl isomerase [Serratia proteamaculans]|uniref:FKBP-type peptidyl-prolyl cis-trans isomerase N-terminal domain-containing protein n=1 Tax=Serratia proteamaculans TaxID=28151 RepID=UPI001076A8D9|nr:FKBP-type peptidyl-prolyl cis-trans isomerase N-terminal domain-containing protein [Serratia proteamaculans]TFZ53062.1 FKBP-type peptidylprolyl isomerase [Serratia proteamaculans]